MTPTPLKNKYAILDGLIAVYSHQIRCGEIKNIQRELNKRYYSEEDIRGAVQWLKKEMGDFIPPTIINKINKAFEDVTKEVSNGE